MIENTERKRIFIQIVLPLILKENNIRLDRKRLLISLIKAIIQ